MTVRQAKQILGDVRLGYSHGWSIGSKPLYFASFGLPYVFNDGLVWAYFTEADGDQNNWLYKSTSVFYTAEAYKQWRHATRQTGWRQATNVGAEVRSESCTSPTK